MNKAILIIVLVLFGALSGHCVMHAGGVVPLVMVHLGSPEAWQIFADLVIVMCLLLVFVYRDATENGRAFWPWAVLSLLAGAFGPLLYFITSKRE